MNERIIVSLTSYGERLNNLPVVLNTIYAQTLLPDKVVLNLALEEKLPEKVNNYLNNHNVEINRVSDTKVYKKILPTLYKYPTDCIICIDDDWLYPEQMIEDFICIHQKYPHNPRSGNRVVLWGMQCHCGCASLLKKEHFGAYLEQIDDKLISACPSSDIVYSFFAAKNGTPYLRTSHEYFLNMLPLQTKTAYSINHQDGIENSYNDLINRFGDTKYIIKNYSLLPSDSMIYEILNDIEQKCRILESNNILLSHNYKSVLYSSAFKLGCFLLKPIYVIKKMRNTFS